MSADPSFRMTIVDVFKIKGRGTIVTGRVESGSVRVGDEMYVQGTNSSGVVIVTGIESFGGHRTQAQAGDVVGILLRSEDRIVIEPGYVLLGSDSEIGQKQSSVEKPKPGRIKTYHNERLGFEMDVPKEWPLPKKVADDTLRFDLAPTESFNVIVGPLLPERLLEYTEFELSFFAQSQGHTHLALGRISVGGKNHVWARYKMENGVWAKKYLIVFEGVEYAMTAACSDEQSLAEREKIWDAIVRSFRLTKWGEAEVASIQAQRKMQAGDLYAKAYEAAAEERYSEACALLEECLRDHPNHILAHKELAFILKNILGDFRGALLHRQRVKQLDPSDQVNRFNLAGLYFLLEAREDALREVDELLVAAPFNWRFLELRRIITGSPLTYPQYYEEELLKQPGEKRNLKLIDAIVPDFSYATYLLLLYQWEENLSDAEAHRLERRATAFVCCAIYDVAIRAGLTCQPSPIPHGLRPAWMIEGEHSPVSLIFLDTDMSERMYWMTIGAPLIMRGEPPSDRARWERLGLIFKRQFNNIYV